jgi:hypothetical protein
LRQKVEARLVMFQLKLCKIFFLIDAILVFGHHFKMILGDVLKIKSQKSAILDCDTILKFYKSLFHEISVLLSAENVEEIFEKSQFLKV